MTKAWAISGVDLHLEITGTQVRAGLEQALRDAISGGRLPAGTRLPATRALAADLGIARNTVAEAYGQLVAEGWLLAVQGSGTRVAERPVTDARSQPQAPAAAQPARYDLQPGVPDLSAFPRAAWAAATRRALAAAPYEALGYGDPRGRRELREALAGYLARARGVHASPERIVVCSGFTQAIGLISGVLHARGARTMAVEQHGLHGGRAAVRNAALQLRVVSVDAAGAAIDELGGADAALLTPAHHFPLGVSLAAERRAAAVRWATTNDAVIVEDDYDGEFRYDRHPLGALQALCPERVLYCGTASKTLAPGVRLGWVVAPEHLLDALVEAKELADRTTSPIDQLTLADLIVTGGYDRHVRRSRLAYRRRRDHLLAELERNVPQVQVTGIAAGLHALVGLGDGVAEAELIARGAQRDLALEGLGSYAADRRQHPHALVVGYATPPEHAFGTAVARLTEVLASAHA